MSVFQFRLYLPSSNTRKLPKQGNKEYEWNKVGRVVQSMVNANPVLNEGIQNPEVAVTQPYLALTLHRAIWPWDTCIDFEINFVPRLSLIDEKEGRDPENYSRLPITRTLANSNLALTPTNIDFPWISFIHLL